MRTTLNPDVFQVMYTQERGERPLTELVPLGRTLYFVKEPDGAWVPYGFDNEPLPDARRFIVTVTPILEEKKKVRLGRCIVCLGSFPLHKLYVVNSTGGALAYECKQCHRYMPALGVPVDIEP